MLRRFQINKRGFTLTEIAIVLGIIGILMGGVFVAAKSTSATANTERVHQQVLQIAQNIRASAMGAYTMPGWPATPAAGDLDVTKLVDSNNVFPSEMRSNPNAAPGAVGVTMTHALGGAMQVLAMWVTNAGLSVIPVVASSPCGSVPCFRIVVAGLSADACSSLIRSIPVEDPIYGVAEAGISNNGTTCSGGCTICSNSACVASATMATGVLSLKQSQANTWCTATSGQSTIIWDFKLH